MQMLIFIIWSNDETTMMSYYFFALCIFQFFCPLWDILSLNHCEPVYFSSKHRSHKLARLKVDDEVGHVKSGDLTRIRGQNGPGDDYLAAAAWHSTVYGATKREKSPSTQLNLSLVEKKFDLRFQTSTSLFQVKTFIKNYVFALIY